MIQIKLFYIVILVLGINLVIIENIGLSFSQTSQSNSNRGIDIKVPTNSLNLSKPLYQAITSSFLTSYHISSKPYTVTKELVFEKGVMKNIGNVTNNMTFINTYFHDGSIQSNGKGVIKTKDSQMIKWIFSDIGTFKNQGYTFEGIVLFNSTNSEKLSFLNNKIGIYKESPEIHRTLWLIQ